MTQDTSPRISTPTPEQERRAAATLAFAIRIAEATIAAKGVPAWKREQARERLAELRADMACIS